LVFYSLISAPQIRIFNIAVWGMDRDCRCSLCVILFWCWKTRAK